MNAAEGYRVFANVAEEWEPLDTLAFGLPESEGLHNAAGFFGVRRGDPVLDFAAGAVRVPRADGIVHWRDFAGEMGVELVAPEYALGWPKRVQVLLSTYRVGDPALPRPMRLGVRRGDELDVLAEVTIPDDGRWHLVAVDVPERYQRETALLFWIDDRENCPAADRHLGRHVAWVQLLGRVMPGTTWSAVAAPERLR